MLEYYLPVEITHVALALVNGVFAMRRGRAPAMRAICYVVALATFGMIYSIARTHHPLGFLYGLLD